MKPGGASSNACVHRSVRRQQQPNVISIGNLKAIHHLLRATLKVFGPHQKQTPDLLQLQTARVDHGIRY